MATLTRGYSFGATEQVTNAKLHSLIEDGAVTDINTEDLKETSIVDDNIASCSGAKFISLASTPSGAGVIPKANLTSVAQKGANSDITSLTGLTTLLSRAQGGLASSVANNAANGVVFLDANSKISAPQLGARVDKTASYGAQQAATDGFVTAYTTYDCRSVGISGYTDSNATPTTRVASNIFNSEGSTVGVGIAFIMFPVRKGDYWKVELNYDATIGKVYWIPLGS